MSLLGVAGGLVGTAVGGPGGGAAGAAVGNNLPGILTNLFGGSGRDAQRQARADWVTEQALAGSVLAARMIIAGPANVASNEDPIWNNARAIVQAQRPDVLNAAIGQGPYWDTTDNDSIDKTRAKINAELATLNATAYAQPGVPTLPVMQSTATTLPPTSYPAVAPAASGINPLFIVGAGLAALVGLVLLITHGRR
jgi:hypothetical protein